MKPLNRRELTYKLGATFDYQQEIIACQDKFRTVVKPRQAGMTTAFAIEALVDAIINDNYVICIVSPTSRQSARMMRYIKKALRLLEKELGSIVPTEKFTSEEVFFHHGSEIYSLPNNPLGIQGIDCNHAIVDEAGLFAQREGEAIIDAILGSLSAKQGRLTISGKPHGKRGLLWQYWDPGNDKYNEFTHFTITWKDRAKHDAKYGKEVEQHRKILAKIQFDETYNAIFIDEGILVFPYSLLEAAVELWRTNRFVLMPPEGKPSETHQKFVGIDFGRRRNLTEIHVLEKVNDILRTLMMKSMTNWNFEDQKAYIDELIARIKPVRVHIDERGMGLPLLDYLQKKHSERLVCPLKLQNNVSKERAILQCRNAFTDLHLAIPDNEELHLQLHSYQKDYTDFGNVRYTGKVDETDFKDDKVIALVAAVDAAQNKPFTFGVV
jgi:hypothetical protein